MSGVLANAWFGVFILLVIAGAAGYSSGFAKGKRKGAPSPHAGEERYRAGYLAGHYAGWQDAASRFGHTGAAAGSTPQARPQAAMSGPSAAVPAAQPPLRPAAPPATRTVPGPVRPPSQRTPPQQTQPRRPAPLTAAERAAAAARKEKRDRQNINITLYVASLLLLASAALFIGSGLPAALRFAGVWAITVLLYAGGFVLEARIPRLRPAALAFTGTGLALLPVTGLAMYNFVLHHGPSAWLVTSLAGTVAYVFAAVRLDSRVLAYLSLTFVVSSAWSGVSMLGGALVWYFVCLIGLAVLLGITTMTGLRGVPSVYLKPLQVLHPAVVPLVALSVTCVPHLLGRGEYALVMAICGLYLALASAVRKTPLRLQHFYGARACLTVAAGAAASDAGAGLAAALFVASLVVAVQALGVAFGPVTLSRWFPSRPHWEHDAMCTFGLQLALALLATLALLFDPGIPFGVPFGAALACAVALAWKLRGPAEFLPPAVLLAVAPFVPALGGFPTSALLAGAAAAWLLRAFLPGAAEFRGRFVLAARIALTLAVPAFAAGILPASREKAAYVLLAFIGACLAQLLLDAAAVRTRLALLAPDASLAGFAAAALGLLPVLRLFDPSADQQVSAVAVLGIAGSAAVAGFLLVGPAQSGHLVGSGPGGGAASAWRPGIREILPPAVMTISYLFSFAALPLAWGNLAFALGLAYFVGQALRLGRAWQRQAYVWCARVLLTLLLCTGYQQYRAAGGSFHLAGEPLQLSSIAFVACGIQLLPALAKSGRQLTVAVAEAGAVLLFMAGAWVALAVAGPEGWQPGAFGLALALAGAAAGFVLRRHAGAAVFAPAALVLLLSLRGSRIHELELILAVFAVFSAVMVPASVQRAAKGVHFAAARVLTAVLAGVLAHDISASATVVSLTFAAVFLLQHAIRYGMRKRLDAFPFQQAAVWITLAAQALLPLGYAAQQPDDGGRSVLLLEFLLLGCSALAASRWLAARGAEYIAVPAAIAAVWAAGVDHPLNGWEWLGAPFLTEEGMLLTLFALALAAMGARLWFAPGPSPRERWFWLAAAAGFTGAAIVVSPGMSWTAFGLAVLLAAFLCFEASHVEGVPAAYAAAVPLTLAGATALAAGMLGVGLPDGDDGAWAGFQPWLYGCAGAAFLLYTLCRAGLPAIRWQPWRRVSLAAGATAGLGLAALDGLLRDETALTGACLLAAAVAAAVAEVPRKLAWNCAEAGSVLVVAAVQRSLLFVHGRVPDFFWVVQWYVVLGAVIAMLCYIRSARTSGRAWLIAGSVLLTLSAAASLLSGTPARQLWILAGYALLLLAGLLLSSRTFTWWGALGVALCVLWALRSYAFAMLALTALALIGFAVWRLNRTKDVAGSQLKD
ncbi:hypothetical protein [Arthrobacter celericrescens]|uniref:hypothetical protein n=1 Tax=Arthrobacter celericrescens TaxID=2320851 RepID=UPI000EA18145|nr:hypothetical protein [Arthrobacter celericrescens]